MSNRAQPASASQPEHHGLSAQETQELRDRTNVFVRGTAATDVDTPYSSLEDAIVRLLPYHIFLDEDVEETVQIPNPAAPPATGRNASNQVSSAA